MWRSELLPFDDAFSMVFPPAPPGWPRGVTTSLLLESVCPDSRASDLTKPSIFDVVMPLFTSQPHGLQRLLRKYESLDAVPGSGPAGQLGRLSHVLHTRALQTVRLCVSYAMASAHGSQQAFDHTVNAGLPLRSPTATHRPYRDPLDVLACNYAAYGRFCAQIPVVAPRSP